MRKWWMLLATALLFARTAAAQPRNYGKPTLFRDEVRIQSYYFDNFFEISSGPKQSRTAAGLEYRAAWHPASLNSDVYVHANYYWWSGKQLLASYGGRVGISHESDTQNFNFFVNTAKRRPSFEVGHTYARADTTLFSGSYSYRVVKWLEVGAEAQHETQSYDTDLLRNNHFSGTGFWTKYYGWGPTIEPQVGFFDGTRHVTNTQESYDDRQWYASLVTEAIPRSWVSVGYRSQGRDYLIADPLSSNFGRLDSGPQWELIAAYRFRPRITGTVYFARDAIGSTQPNTAYTNNLVLLSVSYGLPHHR
jgi:hypothetical protein